MGCQWLEFWPEELLKGIVAAGLGLIIGTIGEGPFNGELRMSSYDYPYLTDGLKLVIVGLGIFVYRKLLPLRKDKAISEGSARGRLVARHKRLVEQ